MKIYIMKQDALDFFKDNMHLFYSNYYKCDTNTWLKDCYGSDPFEVYKVIEDFNLYPIEKDTASSEIEFNNCKILYKALKFISPSQACDERLWAGLCNGTFYQYVRKRWRYDTAKRGDPERDCSTILSRFFFTNSSKGGIYRNTLSKCWWVGYHLYDANSQNLFEKLDILGSNDISTKINEIFYSNNFSANHEILDGIIEGIRLLREENYSLSVRNHIRVALQYLNVIGGGILLDCLSKDEIAELFYDFVVGVFQEDDSSITYEGSVEEDLEQSYVLDNDDVQVENNVLMIMDDSKIVLKNKETNETKKYLVNKLKGTLEYPPLIQNALGKVVGDIFEYQGVEYEVIDVKNKY